MRKRNIFIGILFFEILALPAAAHFHVNLIKKDRTNVIAAEIKSPNGMKIFFVSSDGPFLVSATDLIGHNQIKVNVQGQIGDAVFGANAQLPGSSFSCSVSDDRQEHIIYAATQSTIKNKGEAVSQAVLFSIFYDTKTEPDIKFITTDIGQELPRAKTCSSHT